MVAIVQQPFDSSLYINSFPMNSVATPITGCALLLLVHTCACTCFSSCSFLFLIDVIVRYEEELYSVEEEAGYVTLALVLVGDTAIPVTVSVNTLNLQNSSIEDAATGELLHAAEHIRRGFVQCSL